MRAAKAYVLALACEDLPRSFDEVSLALSRLDAELGRDVLLSLDLVYTPPLRLVCVLHLAPSRDEERVLARIHALAEHGPLRLLDAAGKTPSERAAALREADSRLSIRESGVTDLAPALERLRRFVSVDAPSAAVVETGPSLALFYVSGDQFLNRFSKNRSLYIESEAQLDLGRVCRLSITTGTDQGPIVLSARVVHTVDLRAAAATGAKPGFGVAFTLPAEERDLFESFLIALERGTPWPDRSGRRHERFPVGLGVTYELEGELRRERTDNVSRGGLFIKSFDPPPVDAALALTLQSAGGVAATLQARVTHVVRAVQAAWRGVESGAGVVFTEDAEQVRMKVESLFAASAPAAARRALVADDDQFFRAVLGNTLRQGGFEVLEAADGNAVRTLLVDDGVAVDALLMDLYMPGMTGAELLPEIKRVPGAAGMAVVVISGALLAEIDRDSLTRLGADDVLGKTLPPETLIARVESAMSRRKAAGGA